jgi:hypothetical protein
LRHDKKADLTEHAGGSSLVHPLDHGVSNGRPPSLCAVWQRYKKLIHSQEARTGTEGSCRQIALGLLVDDPERASQFVQLAETVELDVP